MKLTNQHTASVAPSLPIHSFFEQRPQRSILFAIVLLFVLTGCSGASSSSTEQALARLPSITPVQPTNVPSATLPLPTLVPTPSHVAPSPTPSEPALALSANGPVTGSMARLHLTGEQYAALGDPNAPITLVEFADYGCPYCRQYETITFPQLKATYIDTGKIYYVYKHFPITSRQGGIAAQAAECAGEQEQFWQMHEALFQAAPEWDGDEGLARDYFRTYAKQIGLDQQTFDSCLATGRSDAVDRDFNEGMALNLSATPSFFVGAKRLIGAQSFADFAEVIDRELASK